MKIRSFALTLGLGLALLASGCAHRSPVNLPPSPYRSDAGWRRTRRTSQQPFPMDMTGARP